MFQVKGLVQFEYLGKVIKVRYTFWNLAGTPLFMFTDKRGYSHQFQKVFGKWQSRLNVQPKWPADFIEILCEALEYEFLTIYAQHRSTLEGINGIKK